ncbi:MAG: 3-phenylpropionate/trans-cinnamate dioxygenase ferredoxin reductase component [Actinomycetota bacterium]|jgi:3-phenylpropionate/trans-cinnamate dioxygenase ferredoxin reductase subunit|nr:3-phenylpropionate/trans-cinnamate dioxygenase ferredoxin reductase component [Actinomycetota bacterium]
MTSDPGFVIVGAGLAGAKAAQALRAEGFAGSITIVGDEPYRPYERPPLSKEYLQGRSEREKVFVHPEQWYSEHGIDLLLGTEVTAVDPAAHEVTLDDGAGLAYAKLLLATGSTPRRLTVAGAGLEGICYLRRLDDSERIRTAFEKASRVAIIGAGWIGLETAAAARAAGLAVTLLEQAELPLLRVLGPEVADVYADLHRRHGVDLRCKVHVTEVHGHGGRVSSVRLDDGSDVAADLVLVGVGIAPNSDLAEKAGLEVDNGITVDEHLRTSHPDIYAAGDVANAYHPQLQQHIRVEHWANARRQGLVAAQAMLGQDVVYDRLPYFFSDQYDMGMEYTGYVGAAGHDEVVFRGDPHGGEFLAFWLSGGRVLAGMNVNTWDVADNIDELIRSQRTVDLQTVDLQTVNQ